MSDTQAAREAAYRRYRDAGVWSDRTLAREARERAQRMPDTVAFLGETEPATYGELVDQAESLAAGLAELGLRAGDVVSFQLPNWLEAVVIDLAACMLGLVCNPIVPIYRDAEVEFILADCASKAIFIPGTYRGFDYAAMIARLQPRLPALRHVIAVRSSPAGASSYAELLQAGHGRRPEFPSVDPDSVKVLMYTSGTTGRAKGVMHSHNTLGRVLRVCCGYWGLGEGDVILMPSPVTHTTGYSNGIELPFITGTRTVFMERWNAAEAVTLI
ncbi:MAG TPA: AMP-binding protein, partial [Stellaceae bacterium]|nr:AMP-binding protein [Stellaceae bacterium]